MDQVLSESAISGSRLQWPKCTPDVLTLLLDLTQQSRQNASENGHLNSRPPRSLLPQQFDDDEEEAHTSSEDGDYDEEGGGGPLPLPPLGAVAKALLTLEHEREVAQQPHRDPFLQQQLLSTPSFSAHTAGVVGKSLMLDAGKFFSHGQSEGSGGPSGDGVGYNSSAALDGQYGNGLLSGGGGMGGGGMGGSAFQGTATGFAKAFAQKQRDDARKQGGGLSGAVGAESTAESGLGGGGAAGRSEGGLALVLPGGAQGGGMVAHGDSRFIQVCCQIAAAGK